MCRDFECEWLTNRKLPPHLRPDRIGVLFMEDGDVDEYRAVCCAFAAERLAPAGGVRASGGGRQIRPRRRRQGGRAGVAGVSPPANGRPRFNGAHICGKDLWDMARPKKQC